MVPIFFHPATRTGIRPFGQGHFFADGRRKNRLANPSPRSNRGDSRKESPSLQGGVDVNRHNSFIRTAIIFIGALRISEVEMTYPSVTSPDRWFRSFLRRYGGTPISVATVAKVLRRSCKEKFTPEFLTILSLESSISRMAAIPDFPGKTNSDCPVSDFLSRKSFTSTSGSGSVWSRWFFVFLTVNVLFGRSTSAHLSVKISDLLSPVKSPTRKISRAVRSATDLFMSATALYHFGRSAF